MPKFEGKVSFTVTLTVDVVISGEPDSQCEEFDEDGLVERMSESTTNVADTIYDLIQQNMSTIKRSCPTVRDITLDDNNDTDVDEWSQIEE